MDDVGLPRGTAAGSGGAPGERQQRDGADDNGADDS
jgi:hypothetical protein